MDPSLIKNERTSSYPAAFNRKRKSVKYLILFMTIHFSFMLNGSFYGLGWAAGTGEAMGSSRPAFEQRDSAPTMDSRFTPGSAIQVTIWQEPDLSGSYSIDSRGYVILPLVGKVNVSRFTPESLEGYLKEEYSSYLRNPIIQTLPLIRISVIGQIRNPGLFRVEPDRPLWDVIALAEGPNEKGDITGMYVMRGSQVINENLLTAYEEGISLQEIGIKSGDQIVVPVRKGPFPWRTVVSFASLGVSLVSIMIRYR